MLAKTTVFNTPNSHPDRVKLTIPAERNCPLTIPVTEPLVMLARQHNVLRATLSEEIGPFLWSV